MSKYAHIVSADDDLIGHVEVFLDRVEWSYTGDDPQGEIEEYLNHVDGRDAYDWHEEVPRPTDTEQFNEMYIREVAGALETFDPIDRVNVR
jgi:hypothetical protein